MGAAPILALNTVNFPRDRLPLTVLEEILRGGADKVAEAGIFILGGHSVDDPEPKYGLVALGLVHPERVVTNKGARPGDRLVLTKPLGIGIITTALKGDGVAAETVELAVEWMATLNRAASEAMVAVGVDAATDVTGFGLFGHLAEMLRASEVGAVVRVGAVPLLPDVRELAEAGLVPGGTVRNLEALGEYVRWETRLSRAERLIVCDAQTSGGLLMAVPPERLERLLTELEQRGARGWEIGEIVAGAGIDARA